MNTFTFGFMLFFNLVGLLNIGLALPLIACRVKPNGWYGFRTPKTLKDERVWYAANAYVGRLLLGWGVTVMGAAILLYLVPGLRADLALYNGAVAGVVLGGLGLVVVLGLRHLQTL